MYIYKIIIDPKINKCQTMNTNDSSSSTTTIPVNTIKGTPSLLPTNSMSMQPISVSWALRADSAGGSLKRHRLKTPEPNMKSLQRKKRKSKVFFIFRDRKIRKMTNVNKHLL